MKKLSELRGTLKENEQGKLPDPPPMLLLRRKAIRVFPNGQRIALYQNDKLGLDVSVPYFPGKLGRKEIPSVTKEEFLGETIIKKLEAIVKSGMPDNVVFENGAAVQVQPNVADKILSLYNQVNFTNRVKLTRFVSATPKEFKKVVDFTTENQ
jgi:hypothetical protein